MINLDNNIQLQGRLVRDPELVLSDKALRFSVAIDGAGYERDSDNKAGFFTCQVWLTESEWTAPGFVKSVREAFEQGRLAKGVAVRIFGQLSQNRWSDDDGNRREMIMITVEHMNVYARNNASKTESGTPAAEAPVAAAAATTTVEPF